MVKQSKLLSLIGILFLLLLTGCGGGGKSLGLKTTSNAVYSTNTAVSVAISATMAAHTPPPAAMMMPTTTAPGTLPPRTVPPAAVAAVPNTGGASGGSTA